MMALYSRVPKSEWDDAERFEFLVGVVGKVLRMAEVHPSEDNDEHYLFLIWVKPDDTAAVTSQIRRNIAHTDWQIKILPHTGDGLVIVSTWI